MDLVSPATFLLVQAWSWGGRGGGEGEELGKGRVKAVHKIWEKLEGEPVLVSVQKHQCNSRVKKMQVET